MDVGDGSDRLIAQRGMALSNGEDAVRCTLESLAGGGEEEGAGKLTSTWMLQSLAPGTGDSGARGIALSTNEGVWILVDKGKAGLLNKGESAVEED